MSRIVISKEDREQVGIVAISVMMKYLKERSHKGKQMSLEEQCRIVYSVAASQFKELYEVNTEVEEDLFKDLFNLIPRVEKRVLIESAIPTPNKHELNELGVY